jgi:tetratricopeptide (TPR) repeat protein
MKSLLVILALLLCSVTAHADNKATAREAYVEATRYYDLAEYVHALDSFKRAYMNYEDPAFLYNIAQCHRHLGNQADALTFYRNYLRKVPEAHNRSEVLALVSSLEASLAEKQASSNRPPAGALPAQGSKEPQVPAPTASALASPAVLLPSASHPDPDATRAPGNALVVTAQPRHPARTPVYKRWWLWTTVGIVAVAAAGVAVGLTQGRTAEPALAPVHVQ